MPRRQKGDLMRKILLVALVTIIALGLFAEVTLGDIMIVEYNCDSDTLCIGYKKVLEVDKKNEWIIYSKINKNVEDGQVHHMNSCLAEPKAQALGEDFDTAWLNMEFFDIRGYIARDCEWYNKVNKDYFDGENNVENQEEVLQGFKGYPLAKSITKKWMSSKENVDIIILTIKNEKPKLSVVLSDSEMITETGLFGTPSGDTIAEKVGDLLSNLDCYKAIRSK